MDKERKEGMVSEAHKWKEAWSEDAATWYYYNEESNESLWEPPSTGYTKHSGTQLILKNGKIVDDPLCTLTEEDRLAKQREMTCVDCEDAQATRLCDQCGDKYCTPCYVAAHPKGGKCTSGLVPSCVKSVLVTVVVAIRKRVVSSPFGGAHSVTIPSVKNAGRRSTRGANNATYTYTVRLMHMVM